MPILSMVWLLLHQGRELGAILLHDVHCRLHLALATFLAPLDFLSNFFKKLGVFGYKRGHLVALLLGHVAELPARILPNDEALDRHV